MSEQDLFNKYLVSELENEIEMYIQTLTQQVRAEKLQKQQTTKISTFENYKLTRARKYVIT